MRSPMTPLIFTYNNRVIRLYASSNDLQNRGHYFQAMDPWHVANFAEVVEDAIRRYMRGGEDQNNQEGMTNFCHDVVLLYHLRDPRVTLAWKPTHLLQHLCVET